MMSTARGAGIERPGLAVRVLARFGQAHGMHRRGRFVHEESRRADVEAAETHHDPYPPQEEKRHHRALAQKGRSEPTRRNSHERKPEIDRTDMLVKPRR